MDFFKLGLFLLFSIDAMAVVYRCSSNDKSRLAIEINDSGTSALLLFSALQGNAPLVVRTEAMKIFRGLGFEFIFNMQGTQAELKKGRTSKPFNCTSGPTEITCKSKDGKTMISLKGLIMEITDNIGSPKQSFARTDAHLTYQTPLGMEVTFQEGGKAIYSGTKKKGALIDSRGINLNCK